MVLTMFREVGSGIDSRDGDMILPFLVRLQNVEMANIVSLNGPTLL